MRFRLFSWLIIPMVVAASTQLYAMPAKPAERDEPTALIRQSANTPRIKELPSAPQVQNDRSASPDGSDVAQSLTSNLEATALVAGGCFWCIESDFEKLDGILNAVSGYTGGGTSNPSYKTHTKGGHYEAVLLTYDPSIISYAEVLTYFFRHVDPTDDGGQFCDRGASYRTAIFVQSDQERDIALKVKASAAAQLGQQIVTPILDVAVFYEAEDYHQDFSQKNPLRYKLYRRGCGRDARVKSLWGSNG